MRNAKFKVLGLLLFWVVCAVLMFCVADNSETWAGWFFGKRLPKPEQVKLVTVPFCYQSVQPSNSLTDADLVELARRYRIVSDAKTGFTRKQMNHLREIRPEIQIIRYLNLSALSAPEKVAVILRDYPDWAMRDAAGNPLLPRLGTVGLMLRPNSKGWELYLVQKASQFVTEEGYDGIMADCVMMCGRLRNFTGINTETGHPYTTEEFRRHQLELVKAVKSAIGEKSLVLNNVRRGEFYRSQKPDAFLDAADGVVAEGFRGYAHWSLEHYLSDTAWLANVQMMLDVQSRDKAIVVIVKVDKKVAERYTLQELRDYELFQYCTFLLGLEDSAYYTAHVTDPHPHRKTRLFYSHHKINLGSPMGDYEKREGYYQREFERAWVSVDLTKHEGKIIHKGMIIQKHRIEENVKQKGD